MSLTKRFAIAGGAATVVILFGIGIASNTFERLMIRHIVERENIALTQALYNATSRHLLDALLANQPGELGQIAHDQILDMFERHRVGVGVVKLKLYDSSGRIAFSTVPGDIGGQEGEEPAVQAALAGGFYTEFSDAEHETPTGLEGIPFVVSTYMPYRDATGKIAGVFEVYKNESELLAVLDSARRALLATVAVILIVGFGLLLLMVRRLDGERDVVHAEQILFARTVEREQNANRIKDAVLTNLSHELRTPLNAIIGFADLVRMEIFGPAGSAKYVEAGNHIHTAGAQMMRLVENLLEFAELNEPDVKLTLTPVTPAAILEAVSHSVTAHNLAVNVSVEVIGGREPLTLSGDMNRLTRALERIVENAARAAGEGGKVILQARRQGNEVAISVADAGNGMSQEDLDKVRYALTPRADPYIASGGGLGVGLNIARRIVDLHHGRINIESAPGEGTRVDVFLPILDTAPDSDRPSGPARRSLQPAARRAMATL